VLTALVICPLGLVNIREESLRKMATSGKKEIGKIEFFMTELIGKGSFSSVYKGIYENNIGVAIKRVLLDEITSEIEILQENHNHSNIVGYYCSEKDENFMYITMELCDGTLTTDGGTLNEKYMKVGSKQEVIRQICEGLRFLHEKRVVHRDLKPSNILISRPVSDRCYIKLADFDISRKLKTGKNDFTRSTIGKGTVGWTAPELMTEDGSRYTQAADIFSLGCVITFILSDGQHPFGDEYHRQGNIVEGKPQIPDSIHPCIADLIPKMVGEDASARPTIQEIMDHPYLMEPRTEFAYIVDFIAKYKKNQGFIAALNRESETANLFVGDWRSSLSASVNNKLDVGTYKPYQGTSVFHLVKAIRDKYVHYNDLTPEEQKEYGTLPEGFYYYWMGRFPGLMVYLRKFEAAFDEVLNANGNVSTTDSDTPTENETPLSPKVLSDDEMIRLDSLINNTIETNLREGVQNLSMTAPDSRSNTPSTDPIEMLNGGLKARCTLCQIEVQRSNIQQHLSGRKHSNQVSAVNSSYFCPVCETTVPGGPVNRRAHEKGRKHLANVSRQSRDHRQ